MKKTLRQNATPREQGSRPLLLAILVLFALAIAFSISTQTPTGMFTAAPVVEETTTEVPVEPVPAETVPEATVDAPMETVPEPTAEVPPITSSFGTTGMTTEGFSIATATQITSDAHDHRAHRWTPDGASFVYEQTDGTGFSQIYKVSSSGGTETALTSDSFDHSDAEVSPDGTTVAYLKTDGTGFKQVYKIPFAGGSETNLTSDSHDHTYFQWSPNGSKIAFIQKDDSTYGQVWTMKSDGTSATQLTADGSALHEYPSWSPDSGTIAFVNLNLTSFVWELGIIPSGGGNAVELTASAGSDVIKRVFPVWGANSTTVYFLQYVSASPYYHLHSITTSGTELTDVTPAATTEYEEVDLNAANTTFVFSFKDENMSQYNIATMPLATRTITNFTSAGTHSTDDPGRPLWSPDGTKIAWIQNNFPAVNKEIFTDTYTAPTDPVLPSCTTVATSGLYAFNTSVATTLPSCINISTNDVVVDCLGHTITGNRSTDQHGINASSRNNVTIRNCVLTNLSDGIFFTRVRNGTIFNNTIINNSNDGIRMVNTNFTVISHNNLTDNANDNLEFSGLFINVTNNTVVNARGGATAHGIGVNRISSDLQFINNTVMRNQDKGMRIVETPNLIIMNNTFISNGDDSVTVYNSTKVNITFNKIINTGGNGILLTNTNFSFIWQNNISEAGTIAIYLINSSANNITNNTLALAHIELIRLGNNSQNNSFINNTIRTNSTWVRAVDTLSALSNNNFTNTVYENVNGSVRIRDATYINSTTLVNATNFWITPNKAFLNVSSNLSWLNMSAFITLRNITNTTPTAAVDYDDSGTFVACPASLCTNASYDGSTFIFNVSHWTSYRAQEATVDCGSLTSNTVLTQSVTSTSTCFTIAADNVVLDCAGFTVTYDSGAGGGDYGVLASGRTGIAVKNCLFQDGSVGGANSVGINFSTVINSNITNNTLLTNGTGINYGIINRLGSLRNNIRNNTVLQFLNNSNVGYGLYVENVSGFLNISGNNIITNNSAAFGIASLSDNNTIWNNTFNANIQTCGGYSVLVLNSSRNNFTNNVMLLSDTKDGSIASVEMFNINLDAATYNLFDNNSINSTDNECSDGVLGIYSASPWSRWNNFTNNRISQGNVKFWNVNDHVLENNTINGSVSLFNYFLLSGDNVSQNRIIRNDVKNGISVGTDGVTNTAALNNVIEHNRINGTLTIGTAAGFTNVTNNTVFGRSTGLSIAATADNNTFIGNNITTNGTAISISGTNNNFTNNILSNASTWITAAEGTFANFTNTTFENRFGRVRFTQRLPLSGTRNVSIQRLNISQNVSRLNSTNLTWLNSSAVVTLNGLSLSDPAPYVDYTDLDTYAACPADTCTEQSYAGGVFVFNVSHWTSFAGSETPATPETVSPSGTFVINATNATRYGFINGTFAATLFNFTQPVINLSSGNSTGNFTSQIIDVGHAVTWKNISWKSSAIGELPNFRNNSEQDAEQYFVNMTDLLLLMHFNNESTFGENGDYVYDFSGRGHNGAKTALTPELSFTTSSKLGARAARFTSSESDRVSINDTTSFGMIDHMTMSIWIYPTGFIDFERIWVKSHTSNDPPYSIWGLDLDNTPGDRKVDFGVSTGGGSGTSVTSTSRAPADTWTHIVGTYNGSDLVIYINGQREANKSKTGTIDTNSQPVDFAYNRVFTSQHFQGYMDEAALWNRTLSDAEVLRLYKRGINSINLTGVRSCDDAACSGEAMTGFNTTLSPQVLSVSDNRYFQYQMLLGTENVTYSPELFNVTIAEEEPAPPANVTNVTLTKADLSDPVTAGSSLQYNITINNLGTDAAYNVTLSDTYDANVTFSSASPTPIGATNGTFIIGNLTGGQVYVVNITVTVNSGVFNGTQVNNTANISWTNTTGVFNTKNTTISTTVTGDVQTNACRNVTTSGVYRLSQNLTFGGENASCITVTGSELTVDCNGFKLTGNRTEGQQGFNVSGSGNVTIKNCLITNFTDGIVFARVRNATIFNNTVINNSDDGLDIRTTNFSVISYNNATRNFDTNILVSGSWFDNFSNNSVSNAGGDIFSNGFVITGLSNNILVINNTAIDNQNNGFLIAQSYNNSVFNNTAYGNGDDGLRINLSLYNVVRNNLMRNNSDDGISVEISNFTVIDLNNASSNFDNNIIITDGDFNNVTNNTAFNARGDNFANGITLSNNSNNNLIRNNTAINNQDDGIQLLESNYTLVDNNIVANNGDDGVDLSNSTGMNISRNRISNNHFGIALTPGLGSVFANNTIFNNTGDGIFAARHSRDNVIVANTILDHTSSLGNGINIYTNNSFQSNITIERNIIDRTGSYGITILNMSFNITIFNNTLTNPGMNTSSADGIYARDVKGLNITRNRVTGSNDSSIAVDLSENVTIALNTLAQANRSYIFVNESNVTLISNNTITSATVVELKLLNATNVTILDSPFGNFSITLSGITVRDTGEGEIAFNNRSMTASGANFSGNVRIRPNNVTTNLSTLNASANITLYGLSFTNAVAIVDTADTGAYVNCSASICTNTSYDGSTFKFNVSHWTTFSSEEAAIVSTTLNASVKSVQSLNFSQLPDGNFNSSNIYTITYLLLNLSINASNGVDSWYLNFTAAGLNGCALGNVQNNICYSFTNASHQWIQFINGTNTSTFDSRKFADDDGILAVGTSSATNLNLSLRIGEHYTPNIFKHYNASYNFSNYTWEDGASQQVHQSNLIRIHLREAGNSIPLDADHYRFDITMNVTAQNPQSPLAIFVCNSSYTSGDPHNAASCQLVGTRTADQIRQNTHFREVFTPALISRLGDVEYAVLHSNANAATRYYDMKTYKAMASGYVTHWDYSTNMGTSWANLADGYETDAMLHWFYDGTNPTTFAYALWVNDTTGASTVYTNNVTWTIVPTQNYPPIAYLEDPRENSTIILPTTINFTLLDPNIDRLNGTISLFQGSSLISTLITGLNQSNTSTNWSGTADGTYNITLSVCELGTTDLYCANETHEMTVTSLLAYNFTNLSIIKSDVLDPVNVSGQLNYTILINVTNGTAYNVTVNETYPSGVVFSTARPTPLADNVSFLIGNLTVGSLYRINITVNVSSGFANNTLINNTANVTFQNETGGFVSYSVNQSTTIMSLPGETNVTSFTFTKTDSPDPVTVSTYLNYTINLTNTGNTTLINVTVSENYSVTVRFNNSAPSPVAGTNDTFLVNNLTPGQTYLVNITVLVLNVSNATQFNNSANVSFVNASGAFFTQNTTITTTAINLLAYNTTNISVVKSDVSDPVNFSTLLNYTINITSTGTGMAYNVTLNESYPNETIFVSASPTPTGAANDTFLIGNISSGSIYVVNISVLTRNITNGTVINNTANVSFANETGYRANVSDTEQTTVQNITVEAEPEPEPESGSPGGGGGGGGGSLPVVSPAKPCVESWICDEWTACDGGVHERSCYDLTSCGTEKEKPTTSESCAEAKSIIELPKIFVAIGRLFTNSDWFHPQIIVLLSLGTVSLLFALLVEYQLRKKYVHAHAVYAIEAGVLFGLGLYAFMQPGTVSQGVMLLMLAAGVSFATLFFIEIIRHGKIAVQARWTRTTLPLPPQKPSVTRRVTSLLQLRSKQTHVQVDDARMHVNRINLELKEIKKQLKKK